MFYIVFHADLISNLSTQFLNVYAKKAPYSSYSVSYIFHRRTNERTHTHDVLFFSKNFSQTFELITSNGWSRYLFFTTTHIYRYIFCSLVAAILHPTKTNSISFENPYSSAILCASIETNNLYKSVVVVVFLFAVLVHFQWVLFLVLVCIHIFFSHLLY